MFRNLSAALALVLLAGFAAWTKAEPDLSTPKKAAMEYVKSLESDDMAAAKSVAMGSDDDFKLVQVIRGLVRSARDLRSSAVEKFGEAGTKVLPEGDEMAEFAKSVDAGTEKISGDTATIKQPDGRELVKLKKAADGTWRVDLSAIPERAAISRMFPEVEKVFNNAIAEIKAGKYKTVDEAKDAISQQMFGVIAEPAASQPADPGKK